MQAPGAPADHTPLCQLRELSDPGSKGFEFGEGAERFRFFVVRRADAVFAYRNLCPHAGHPLDFPPDRFLTPKGDYIHCASHGALFTPEDGVCVGGPCVGRRLLPIPVYVEAGMICFGEPGKEPS
ncbi:MAG: Rieske (2Fe-2S) protein [Alphaproteobacteria bacterium]|nr:MAG: Rieske (2Fe-2S) protein [Alphaproteobacteria bacterium]